MLFGYETKNPYICQVRKLVRNNNFTSTFMFYKKKRSKKKFTCQVYSSKNGKLSKEQMKAQIEAVAMKAVSQKYIFMYVEE